MTSQLEYLSAQEHAADLRRSADRARLGHATDPVNATARRAGLIARIVTSRRRRADDAEDRSAAPATPSAR